MFITYMVILGTTIFIAAPEFIRLFRDDETVISIATLALRYQCVAVIFLPFGMVTEMLFQSTGNKVQAIILLINFMKKLPKED